MSIDLERFPWSDSANRMLTYVTKGWYDKSYVGKWIYEVMGRELDLATVHIEELPYQMFIDTATWGLKYHEIKYLGYPSYRSRAFSFLLSIFQTATGTLLPFCFLTVA